MADALFMQRKAVPLLRRLRCDMHIRVFRVTWEVPACPVRVTMAISETKSHGKQAGKSEQGIVAVIAWKHAGAKDLQSGPFLLQGRRHNSGEVLYAEY